MPRKEKQYINTKQVCQLLGKTPMTVFNYRKGTNKTITPLPFYLRERGERHSVLYVTDEVVRWAKKNGLDIQPLLSQEQ